MAEAPQRLSTLVPPIDPMEMAEEQRAAKVHVWNVCPRTFSEAIPPYGVFTIPACPEGEPVSEPLVFDGWYRETATDTVEGRTVQYKWLRTAGIRMANDIVGIGPGKHESQRLTRYGVFISEGVLPTAEELAKAHAAWDKFCSELIQDADQKFSVNGGFEMDDYQKPRMAITKDHVTAAKQLSVDRPWAKTQGKMMLCPECGESNIPTAARCKNQECRCIFDEAKARQRYPEMFANEKRGPGRPKSVEVDEA